MIYRLLAIASLSACARGADRSPPARDVGLPEVPQPPAELQLQPQIRTRLPAEDPVFTRPPGCEPPTPRPDGGMVLPWVGVWRCKEKREPGDLGTWQRGEQLPVGIYRRDDLEWIDTWSKTSKGWKLTRTVGSPHPDP